MFNSCPDNPNKTFFFRRNKRCEHSKPYNISFHTKQPIMIGHTKMGDKDVELFSFTTKCKYCGDTKQYRLCYSALTYKEMRKLGCTRAELEKLKGSN